MSVSEMLSNTCGPVQHCGALQHSRIILFIRFHNPKEPCGEGETEKRESSFLPPPMSFLKFHFILLSLFKELFLCTCIFRCCNPAPQDSELAHRQATSHSLEQSEKRVHHHHPEKDNKAHRSQQWKPQLCEKSSKTKLHPTFLLSFV